MFVDAKTHDKGTKCISEDAHEWEEAATERINILTKSLKAEMFH